MSSTTTDTHRAAIAIGFTHHPRPPILQDEERYAWQRRFGDASHVSGYKLDPTTDAAQSPSIKVMRDAETDVAMLDLEIGLWTCARTTVRLTTAELRELAARLLDAAHDIETFPAAVLMESAA